MEPTQVSYLLLLRLRKSKVKRGNFRIRLKITVDVPATKVHAPDWN